MVTGKINLTYQRTNAGILILEVYASSQSFGIPAFYLEFTLPLSGEIYTPGNLRTAGRMSLLTII
jgi:hypothetical protein